MNGCIIAVWQCMPWWSGMLPPKYHGGLVMHSIEPWMEWSCTPCIGSWMVHATVPWWNAACILAWDVDLVCHHFPWWNGMHALDRWNCCSPQTASVANNGLQNSFPVTLVYNDMKFVPMMLLLVNLLWLKWYDMQNLNRLPAFQFFMHQLIDTYICSSTELATKFCTYDGEYVQLRRNVVHRQLHQLYMFRVARYSAWKLSARYWLVGNKFSLQGSAVHDV